MASFNRFSLTHRHGHQIIICCHCCMIFLQTLYEMIYIAYVQTHMFLMIFTRILIKDINESVAAPPIESYLLIEIQSYFLATLKGILILG